MISRERLWRLAPWLVAISVLVGFAAASGAVFHDARCALTLPEVDPPARRNRLLGCSNIEQRLDGPVRDAAGSAAVRDTPAGEAPGWSVLSPGESGTAVIKVTLRKYADRVVFYPRVHGPDASVTVNEPIGPFRKKLFSLSGRQDVWSPLGNQYSLCLGCLENGWSDEEFPVTLEIVLTGRGSQLWHKGDTVFFEAP